MNIPEFKIGMSKSVHKVITRDDTALNFGTGALNNILATPALVALMIEAAVNSIDPLLPDNYITIGKRTEIEHEYPTKEGMTVTVTAKLIEINGNVISFEITAHDELGRIGLGYHERQIVSHNILMKKIEERFKIMESRP
ncbi:MAG: hypothetical protein PHS15_02950 [Clostridiaceae bacterium]|nr:hypothetical protein [Clostridiaceae bacterium]